MKPEVVRELSQKFGEWAKAQLADADGPVRSILRAAEQEANDELFATKKEQTLQRECLYFESLGLRRFAACLRAIADHARIESERGAPRED